MVDLFAKGEDTGFFVPVNESSNPFSGYRQKKTNEYNTITVIDRKEWETIAKAFRFCVPHSFQQGPEKVKILDHVGR